MGSNLLNIARIVDYIEVHLEEKLDLESIAKVKKLIALAEVPKYPG